MSDHKQLEEVVWKFLDLLDSRGHVLETGQSFPLVTIDAPTRTHREKALELIEKLRSVSNHKSLEKYQENYKI